MEPTVFTLPPTIRGGLLGDLWQRRALVKEHEAQGAGQVVITALERGGHQICVLWIYSWPASGRLPLSLLALALSVQLKGSTSAQCMLHACTHPGPLATQGGVCVSWPATALPTSLAAHFCS